MASRSLSELEDTVAELIRTIKEERERQSELKQEVEALQKDVELIKANLANSEAHDTTISPLKPKKSEKSPTDQKEDQTQGSSRSLGAKRASFIMPKTGDVIAEGNLEKKSFKKKVWVARYFQLRKSGSYTYIFHYLNKDEMVLKGMVQLEGAKLFTHVEKNGKYKELLFGVRSSEKNLLLRAASREEKDHWCSILETHIPGLVSPPIQKTTSMSAMTVDEAPKMTGILTKKDLSTGSSWKSATSRSTNERFTSEKKSYQGKSANKVIPLRSAELFTYCEKRGVAQPLMFNLKNEGKDFLMIAPTKEEKEEWCKAIKAAISALNNNSSDNYIHSKEKYEVPISPEVARKDGEGLDRSAESSKSEMLTKSPSSDSLSSKSSKASKK